MQDRTADPVVMDSNPGSLKLPLVWGSCKVTRTLPFWIFEGLFLAEWSYGGRSRVLMCVGVAGRGTLRRTLRGRTDGRGSH